MLNKYYSISINEIAIQIAGKEQIMFKNVKKSCHIDFISLKNKKNAIDDHNFILNYEDEKIIGQDFDYDSFTGIIEINTKKDLKFEVEEFIADDKTSHVFNLLKKRDFINQTKCEIKIAKKNSFMIFNYKGTYIYL